MDHPWANEIPYRRNYATLFGAIRATATSLFFKRIVVFAAGRSSTARAKKVNIAENEQICPWSDGERAGDFGSEESDGRLLCEVFSVSR